jgi:hypothetical protein
MSRRIEVELTSQQDDGTWTWRAAGAKQPKGTLDAALLAKGAAVGDVVRAEADFEIDGIFVTAVTPLKSRSGRPADERLEIIAGKQDAPGVTTQLARKSKGDRGRDGDDKKRRGKPRSNDKRNNSEDTKEKNDRSNNRSEKSKRPDSGSKRPARNKSNDRDQAPERPKVKKLRPGRVHRKLLIESLPEEQRVIAEQVARGGIAAVRTEIETQNKRLLEEGQPVVKADALMALAESLVPRIKIAEWRDRADAVVADLDEVDIRDLRTILVAAEDNARDEESRQIAERIREGLNLRVEKAQADWHAELRSTLSGDRIVRALRLSSRPPKAGAPLPPDIAEQLTMQANQALGGEVTQQRLAIVIEAIAFSPIRPYIVLATVPAEPTKELVETIRKVADRIPEIAARFGIEPSKPGRGKGRRKGPGKPKPKPAAPQTDQESVEPTSDESIPSNDSVKSDATEIASPGLVDPVAVSETTNEVVSEEFATEPSDALDTTPPLTESGSGLSSEESINTEANEVDKTEGS